MSALQSYFILSAIADIDSLLSDCTCLIAGFVSMYCHPLLGARVTHASKKQMTFHRPFPPLLNHIFLQVDNNSGSGLVFVDESDTAK